MALPPGSRLGSFEILSTVGKGGMGEVYRAHDTKLGRDVAIKVLPEAFAADKDRVTRFEREARTLAALNHPNIAQLYGIESGALVMELVEGNDLSRLIARGPIAVEPALAIARQIASALDFAHEQGIVHRDLKPANIKVRPDDTVKVLDFGLAKALGQDAEDMANDVTNSPTMTARATALGVVLGTAAYMAPEQARGKPVDRRADIWAFGAVLFEMLAGKLAFGGDEVSDILAAILKSEPDWSSLPAGVQPPLRHLLRRCLEKDPKKRLRDISEGMLQLDEGLAAATPVVGVETSRKRLQPFWRRALPLATACVAVAFAFGTGWWLRTPAAVSGEVIRFPHLLPAGMELTVALPSPDIAIAHDGRAVVYAVRQTAVTQYLPRLYARSLDQPAAVLVRGSEGGSSPFVSPDNQWIGFVESLASNRIKKVPFSGGPAIAVGQIDVPSAGATWLVDGTIVVGTLSSGLRHVSADGTSTELTTIDRSLAEASHCWPSVIPGTTTVLFTIVSARGKGSGVAIDGTSTIAAIDVATKRTVRFSLLGSSPRYATSGHVVFASAGGQLGAVPFDVGRLQITGSAVTVLEGVALKPWGVANFDLSDNGRLAFVGAVASGDRSLVWIDRRGLEQPLTADRRVYYYPRISRDGRLALDVRDQERDIWIWDPRGTLTKLTKGDAADEYGLWTPDGRRVIFTRRVGQVNGILWTRADGIGEPELIVDRTAAFPNAVTNDGKTLIFRAARAGNNDILSVPLEGEHTVKTLIGTEYDELNPALSPDNRWMAYQSNLSGRMEVYVRPYPEVDRDQMQISTGGGSEPLWAPEGTEIFYRGGDNKLTSVSVSTGAALAPQPPVALFDLSNYASYIGRNYDIAPDGKRFVMVKNPAVPAQSVINVVLNWTEELKRASR